MNDIITFQETTIRERIARIARGLRADPDSGDHKYAIYALQRIFGPSSASFVISLLVMILIGSMAMKPAEETREYTFTYIRPEVLEPDKVEPPEPKPEFRVTDLPMREDAAGGTVPEDVPDLSDSEGRMVELSEPVPTVPVLPRWAKSTAILLRVPWDRSPVGREKAREVYRAPQGTEYAVLRALRWLKQRQKEDGSWGGEEVSAMTGLALLSFLAHGETQNSAEFGATLEKGMKHLISVQKPSGEYSASAYAHGIAAYAMCEAFAMTKILSVKESAEKGIQAILAGQQPLGSYNYNYTQVPRWDMSVSGWQFQALKAGHMAGIGNEGLGKSIEKATDWLKRVAFDPAAGGFGYSAENAQHGGATWTMTGAGCLCMQLMGRPKDMEVRAGLDYLDELTCRWEKGGKNRVYGWYYVTQAMFQDGGKRWDRWNRMFAPELVKAQFEDGHWEGGDYGKEVYSTTLCCLMLEVYYRYLPTYRKVEEHQLAAASDKDDIVIQVR